MVPIRVGCDVPLPAANHYYIFCMGSIGGGGDNNNV